VEDGPARGGIESSRSARSSADARRVQIAIQPDGTAAVDLAALLGSRHGPGRRLVTGWGVRAGRRLLGQARVLKPLHRAGDPAGRRIPMKTRRRRDAGFTLIEVLAPW